MTYPATRAEAVVDTLHGVEVADPYRWLEDEKSPEVQAWMKAQDAFTRARSLTRDSKLLGIIEANLALVTQSLGRPAVLDDLEALSSPGGETLPLPDVAYLRHHKPRDSAQAAQPRKRATRGRTSAKKTSTSRGGKKPASKRPRS